MDEEENVKEASASVSVVRPFDAATTNAMCEKMIDIFTEALGGDKVAASYALFLAALRIRLRTDEFPVGSLCVNFSIDCALSKEDGESKRKRNDNLVNALASALQSLCPATACLSVDVPRQRRERGCLKKTTTVIVYALDLYSSRTVPFVSWTKRNYKRVFSQKLALRTPEP